MTKDSIVYVSTSSDTGKRTNTRDRYEYRKTIQFQEKSISKISNSSQPIIEEKINRRAGDKQASEHPSGAKKAGGMDNK